jgi:hypothetical protein
MTRGLGQPNIWVRTGDFTTTMPVRKAYLAHVQGSQGPGWRLGSLYHQPTFFHFKVLTFQAGLTSSSWTTSTLSS